MTLPPERPRRGEIYLADLDPVVGNEQAGRRPFLVLSLRRFNKAPAALAIGVPLTTTEWPSDLHVRIEPANESGLSRISYAMPEMIRSVSVGRFGGLLGRVPADLVETASARAGVLIGLGRTRF
jgi:mRNA interferase MazF